MIATLRRDRPMMVLEFNAARGARSGEPARKRYAGSTAVRATSTCGRGARDDDPAAFDGTVRRRLAGRIRRKVDYSPCGSTSRRTAMPSSSGFGAG